MAKDFLEQDSHPAPLTPEDELIVREAVARHEKLLSVDSTKELTRFKQKIDWQRKRHRWMWSAAASLIFIIGIGAGLLLTGNNPFANEKILVYEANDSIDEVMLYVGGKSINLQSDSAHASVSQAGATLDADLLAYDGDAASQSNTLSIPNGKTYCVTLADGTVVWLNSHSTLTYPSAFKEKERRVILTGEAYFKVAKDAVHPFIVQANGVETKVLGTEFNVRNYPEGPSDVTLVEGSVVVKTGKHTPVRLLPGQNMEIETNGRVSVTSVDIREYTEWKDGYFYFDNKTLSEVFYIIGRYYNVSVVCTNPKLMSKHFNLWIDMKKPLEDNLKLINEVGDMQSFKNENTVTIK